MNTVLRNEVAVSVVEVPKKLRLRPWVKVVSAIVLTVSIGTGVATVFDKHMVSEDELASKVTWVDAYAHDGDGYERMVREANGNKALDIKVMSHIMQEKNHGVDIQAGVVYKIPVLEAK